MRRAAQWNGSPVLCPELCTSKKPAVRETLSMELKNAPLVASAGPSDGYGLASRQCGSAGRDLESLRGTGKCFCANCEWVECGQPFAARPMPRIWHTSAVTDEKKWFWQVQDPSKPVSSPGLRHVVWEGGLRYWQGQDNIKQFPSWTINLHKKLGEWTRSLRFVMVLFLSFFLFNPLLVVWLRYFRLILGPLNNQYVALKWIQLQNIWPMNILII